MENNRLIKVCYFGTYRETYNRNQMMIAGLRLNGITVYECHETLWHGIEDRVNIVKGGWKQLKFLWRVVRTYSRLIIKYLNIEEHDVLIVGYPGQLDVYLSKVLSWFTHRPLVWDIFMSIYLVAIERELDKKNRFSINLLHLLECMSLKLPDRLILDTNDYVHWFTDNYKIDSKRFRLVPTGADDRIFFPLKEPFKDDGSFTVLYAGTYIPNHGVKYIVEAAKYLINEPGIALELIGEGPDLAYAREYVQKYNLRNVKFLEWIAKDELVKHIWQADICLGAFGKTPQSMMTVQNKIYEALAMAKPLISGDSLAIRNVCKHLEHIYLCDRANGKSLAEAIMVLRRDSTLRSRIAINGYKLFVNNYSLMKNGSTYKQHICELIK